MIELPNTMTKRGQTEASIILAKIMGWETKPYNDPSSSWCTSDGISFSFARNRMSMFVGIYDDLGNKVSSGDQPYDDDDLEKHWRRCPNFYEPSKMALAWRVLNWLYLPENHALATMYMQWRVVDCNCDPIEWLLPEDAQKAWLDKILQLANEAGMLVAAALQDAP